MSAPARNGARNVSILTINQAGTKFSGTLAPDRGNASTGFGASGEIYDGKVEGSTIAFYIWRGSDKPTKQFYKGVIHDEQIDFTVTGGPASNSANPNAQPTGSGVQITAKRAVE